MWDGERIKNLRKSLDLSQNEFAELIGCRQQTISEWELGLYAPANAYTRILNSIVVDADQAKWLSGPKAKRAEDFKQALAPFSDNNDTQLFEQQYTEVREFDPAID